MPENIEHLEQPQAREHRYKVGVHSYEEQAPPADDKITGEHRKHIEPWLTALAQSEHLSLLIGSGFTHAAAHLCAVKAPDMSLRECATSIDRRIKSYLQKDSSQRPFDREPNFEDQLQATLTLAGGLAIIGRLELANDVQSAIRASLFEFRKSIVDCEHELRARFECKGTSQALDYLQSFLLSFASRAGTRDRLNIFTTNYDRLIEYVSDAAGLRLLDRFVGTLSPIFRSTRLGIDIHYNPPGIRGEPRYLEGVVRFSKLHGSVDWIAEHNAIRKVPLSFGDSDSLRDDGSDVLIYPNASKDVETSMYPYSDLFRDFSAAVCRPNATLITYGYGFGDSHINNVITDMMTLHSTHLVVISYDDAGGRVSAFLNDLGKPAQTTVLLGSHFGDLETLVKHYLPKPAIDPITMRAAELVRRRTVSSHEHDDDPPEGEPNSEGGEGL